MKNLSSLVKSIRDIMRNDPGINGDAQRMEQIIWILFLKVYSTREENWEFDEDDYTSIIPEECQWSNWAVDNGTGKALTGDELLNFVNNTLFDSLIDGLHRSRVSAIGLLTVAVGNSGVELLQRGLKRGFLHLVAGVVDFGHQNSLLGRLNVGHDYTSSNSVNTETITVSCRNTL